MNDLINRQTAIDSVEIYAEMLRRVLDDTDIVGNDRDKFAWGLGLVESFISDMKELPSEEPKTKLIAEVKMSKEDIRDAVDNAVEKIKAEMEEPEIIRCKDCKYYLLGSDGIHFCFKHDDDVLWQDNDFCSKSERRTDE